MLTCATWNILEVRGFVFKGSKYAGMPVTVPLRFSDRIFLVACQHR